LKENPEFRQVNIIKVRFIGLDSKARRKLSSFEEDELLNKYGEKKRR
jgi:hypothetical protein